MRRTSGVFQNHHGRGGLGETLGWWRMRDETMERYVQGKTKKKKMRKQRSRVSGMSSTLIVKVWIFNFVRCHDDFWKFTKEGRGGTRKFRTTLDQDSWETELEDSEDKDCRTWRKTRSVCEAESEKQDPEERWTFWERVLEPDRPSSQKTRVEFIVEDGTMG